MAQILTKRIQRIWTLKAVLGFFDNLEECRLPMRLDVGKPTAKMQN